MCVSQIVKFRRIAAAGALAALMLYGNVQADVLEEIPSDAMAVLKIKDLDSMNTKVAKMAKTFGLDEIKPEMKDPLNALLEAGHMTKGINKAGDAALVLFAPEKGAGKQEPVAVALVPVSDYDAFVGNFKKADGAAADGGEITTVQDPEEAGKSMYVAHRGHYAIVSDKKERLSGQDKGIKLSGAAAHDADTKDAVFFFNMKVVRDKALPELKAHRKEWLDEMHKGLAGEEKLKQFTPVIDTVVNEGMDIAQNFLNDADAIVFSASLSDEGLTGGGLVQFAPDSKYGKFAAQLKPTTTPLLAGLPDRKYLLFGGSSLDCKALAPMVDEMLDPVIKGLKDTNNDIGKRLASVLDSAKTLTNSSTHQAMGWVMPSKPLGAESIFQQISVTYGDAKAMAGAQKAMLGDVNDLMALAPNQGAKAKTELGETKEVDGVKLQTFTTKFEVDENDPRGMQMQQLFAMLYGPNGMSGSFGAVDDNAFVTSQGASDELLKEVIEAAKLKKDSLSASAGVKTVNAQLPRENFAVYYVALDNIVTSAVKYAQGFGLPIKMKLPQNLSPIGVTSGAEGSAVRIDGFIPATTVQSLIAAGIDAYTQMQQKGQGGGL